MITAGDFRKGVTFELDGNVYLVVDFCMSNQEKVLHLLEQNQKRCHRTSD